MYEHLLVLMNNIYPILTCEESAALEMRLLGHNNTKIWNAMNAVGKSAAKAILEDFKEIGPIPLNPNILVLLGTGHNAGDAILTAAEILQQLPQAKIQLLFALGQEKIKPLTQKALASLPNYKTISLEQILIEKFDISLDGILGMSFHLPIKEPLLSIINTINKHPNIRLRASIDIPSGLALKADFSYATGTAKTPLFDNKNREIVGRVRFLDIGFFEKKYEGEHTSKEFLLEKGVLNPLKKLRDVEADKRKYGHLFILSGSKNYPGALMMCVKSAIKSGVGLITVFAPESLVPSFASEAPEAIWVPFPETASGSLALSGKSIFLERLHKGTALLSGPGIGEDPETLQLISEIVEICGLPILLDANALMPQTFAHAKKRPSHFGAVIATPHLGEFERISEKKSLIDWNIESHVITLLKGSISKIAYEGKIYNSTYGGPVLARGGSGDILSGLIGGLLAQTPLDPFGALSKAVVWHGMSADALARTRGQVAVRTTDLCDYFSTVLHNY